MSSEPGRISKALSPFSSPAPAADGNVVRPNIPEWMVKSKPSSIFAGQPTESLSEGIWPIEEIRSAVAAIPPAAVTDEEDWMKFARALAHHAAYHPDLEEQLWQVLDQASRGAANYDEAENRSRWERYQREALGRTDPITIATVFHLAVQHNWNGSSPLPAGPAPSVPPAPTLPVWSAAALQVPFANIPHRRWLYGTDLIRGEITFVAAPGGVGKTALVTGIATEIATGTQVLEQKIWGGPDLSVLFLNGEDAGVEIARRILAFCLAHPNDISAQNLGRLLVAGCDDPHVQRLKFLRVTDKGASLVDPEGFKVLEAGLQQLRPDLLILDPLVAFCGGANMNDNAVMSLVIRELKRLAAKFDCAILTVHHTRKGGDLGNAEAISGAAAIVNLARRAIMPVPMTEDEAKKFGVLPSDRLQYFKVVDAKSNLAPRSADSPWYKLHSIELPNPEPPVYPFGDYVQAVVRENLSIASNVMPPGDEQKIQKAVLELVERGKIIKGVAYPYSPSSAGATNERALLEDAMAAVAQATAPREWSPIDLKAVTQRAIDDMRDTGVLIDDEMSKLMDKPGRFKRGRGVKASQDALSRLTDDQAATDIADAPHMEGEVSEAGDGIPLMITQAQKAQLLERGYSSGEIFNMTPTDAHKILSKPASPKMNGR
jgi:hypothetical protein